MSFRPVKVSVLNSSCFKVAVPDRQQIDNRKTDHGDCSSSHQNASLKVPSSNVFQSHGGLFAG